MYVPLSAICFEAKKNGFSYDAETEYKAYMDSMEEFTQGQELFTIACASALFFSTAFAISSSEASAFKPVVKI